MVCDDDYNLLTVLAGILEAAGFSVDTASDGIEAFSKAKKAQPDYFGLILIDHVMPGINGLGLVKELRANGIPGRIIVLSGHLDEELEAEFNRLAVDKILLKPNGITELARCAADLLSE